MNLTTFLNETPLWILVLLGFIYVAVVGYYVYIAICLFKKK